MNCPKCNTRLDVTHIYQVNEYAETRNLKCQDCGYVSSSITLLTPHHLLPGAAKLKTLINSGEVRIQVDYVPKSQDPSN